MIDNGYLFAKDNKRIFINTSLGCAGQCAYCYLPKMGYSNSSDNYRTISAQTIIEFIEKNTTPISNRFQNFSLFNSLDIPVVLYMKPVLKGITINDLELYKKYIEKYNIKDVVVGSIFTNYISEETVHFSNKNELFYTKNSDEDMIISELSKITNVYKRSSEVMYKYNVSNHIEKVKNEVAKLLEGDNS